MILCGATLSESLHMLFCAVAFVVRDIVGFQASLLGNQLHDVAIALHPRQDRRRRDTLVGIVATLHANMIHYLKVLVGVRQ